MEDKILSLDEWMRENRWSNTNFANALTEKGHSVTHSTISQIRNKKQNPSPQLAYAIYEFINKEIPLEVLLGVK